MLSMLRGGHAELPAQTGEFFQYSLHLAVDGFRREMALRIRGSGGNARQYFDAVVDIRHGINVELALLHGLAHIPVQHKMIDIRGRYEHALLTRKAALVAQVEESLDLLIHRPDRLHIPMLVQRARDRQRLLYRHIRYGGKQRVKLGGEMLSPSVPL